MTNVEEQHYLHLARKCGVSQKRINEIQVECDRESAWSFVVAILLQPLIWWWLA